MRVPARRAVAALLLAAFTVAGLWAAFVPGSSAQDPGDYPVFLPLGIVGDPGEDFGRAPTAPAPTATPDTGPTTEPTTAPTDEPTAEPTDEPTSEPTAVPTEEPTPGAGGFIRGRLVSRGEPMAAGFGAPGFPQIELKRLEAGEWTLVANAMTEEDGVFTFESPPPLEPGQVYQVWWVNDSLVGWEEWVGRWFSRRVASFAAGDEVDLGTMEIGDLTLTEPGNDIHFSLPTTYEWEARDNPGDSYKWSLYKTCDEAEREDADLYRTSSLGRREKYELGSAPRGYRLNERYCWYVFIEDGTAGTGWSFYRWRTLWLSLSGDDNRQDPQ